LGVGHFATVRAVAGDLVQRIVSFRDSRITGRWTCGVLWFAGVFHLCRAAEAASGRHCGYKDVDGSLVSVGSEVEHFGRAFQV
jgi:hypothetical protein